MATYVACGVRTSNKNLWVITDDGSTLTVSASYDIANGASVGPLYCIVKDLAGSYYAALYVNASTRYVIKLDSSFSIDTTWATSGIYTPIASFVGRQHCLAVDSQGYLAIAHAETGTPDKTVTLLDSTGTVVWQADHQDGASEFTGAVRFTKAGDVVGSGSRASGSNTGAKYSRTDGSNLQSYYTAAGATTSTGCWVFQDEDVAIFQGTNCVIRKCSATDVQEFSLTLSPADLAHSLVADASENIYIGTNRTNNKSLYKVLNDGSGQSSYDTGGIVYAVDTNPSGEIVAAGVSGTDEDSNVGILRVFNSGLTLSRYTADAALGTIYSITAGGSGAQGSSVPYWEPKNQEYSKTRIAIGNNEIWYESTSGTMTELTAAHNTLDTSKPVDTFSADGRIFIVNEANKKVVDFRNTKITTADVGANLPSRGAELTGDTSGAKMYVDLITSGSGACTIYGKRTTVATFTNTETVTGTGSVSFVLNADEVAPPHYYDWITYAADTSTYGSLPAKATIAAWYLGRPVLSGNDEDPHQWYMGYALNPWVFDYNASTADELRAVAGGYAQAGKIPDVVVGVMPYKDDYCVFGCVTSCYYMIGNPGGAGEIFELKGAGGLLSNFSWAWDVSGNLYMLTTKGLLRIPANFGSLENLTVELWPEFVTDLAYDEALHRLTIGYDQKRNGIKICKATIADGSSSCWWYDLNTNGLFPESYSADHTPFCQYYSEHSGELLLGGFDGYIRHHDDTAKNDDGTAINSYVSFGPIPLANGPITEGSIGPIDVVLGGGASSGSETDSDDAAYKVFVADTASELVEKLVANGTPSFAGTITGPGRRRGSKKTQSARGVYGGVRVGNSASGESFIFECLNAGQKAKGRSK